MEPNTINNYILESRNRQQTDDQIISSLKNAGWTNQQLNPHFPQLKPKRKHKTFFIGLLFLSVVIFGLTTLIISKNNQPTPAQISQEVLNAIVNDDYIAATNRFRINNNEPSPEDIQTSLKLLKKAYSPSGTFSPKIIDSVVVGNESQVVWQDSLQNQVRFDFSKESGEFKITGIVFGGNLDLNQKQEFKNKLSTAQFSSQLSEYPLVGNDKVQIESTLIPANKTPVRLKILNPSNGYIVALIFSSKRFVYKEIYSGEQFSGFIELSVDSTSEDIGEIKIYKIGAKVGDPSEESILTVPFKIYKDR